MNVNILALKIAHHSAHSGYARLPDFLPGATCIHPPTGFLDPLLLRIYHQFVRPRCDLEWYTLESFKTELVVFCKPVQGRDRVYHYLYAETQYWLLREAALHHRCKVVATFHQPPAKLREVVGDHPGKLRSLAAAIVVARSQVECVQSLVGRPIVHVVPLGVDVDFFVPLATRPVKDRPRCLFVGNWLRDFDTLIKVIQRCLEGNEIEFAVVAQASKVAALAGCNSVRILTDIDEAHLLELYQTADLTLVPLLDGTANNVLLESLACGTPVIVTDVGGSREYVDPSCGILTSPGDADVMATAVVDVLGDTLRLEGMRKAARQRALQFDWRNMARSTLAVYRKTLST